MLEFLKNTTVFQILSITEVTSALLGFLIAGLAYRGRLGEHYSPLNYFISELGELGVSRLAWVFNLSLILCGLFLIPASISLGLLLPGTWSKLGMLAGISAAIGISLVGVFPMNKLKPHSWAAFLYFRMGLVMILFFTLSIALQSENPILPRSFSLAGLPALLAFLGFIVYSRVKFDKSQDPLAALETARPRVWDLALLEWFTFLTIAPWFLAIAIGI